MIKAASTTQIIKLLQQYEAAFGPGSVTSIGSFCSGERDNEYVFHIQNKHGQPYSIYIPSIEEHTIWED
jgi:hypothetical protein